MVQTHLNLTLQFDGEQKGHDLRVPLQVTLQQLIQLTRESLGLEPLSEPVRGKIERNHQLLSGMDYLLDAPLQNGDRLFIF